MWDGNEAQKRASSCDLGFGIEVPDAIVVDQSIMDKPENKLLLTTDGQAVPAENVEAMMAYAKELHRKFPHMKESRVKRKVAEHFKIKLT